MALSLQLGESSRVEVVALGLPDQLAVPRQAEPREILELAELELLAATVDVEVVDAQLD